MVRRSGAAKNSIPDIEGIVETRSCGLLGFASVPAEYNDLQFLGSVEVHDKYILAE